MKKKLIFLDIDGTLTMPGQMEPPESAISAIKAAQANGHRVFLCTGRNLFLTRPLLKYGFDGAVCSAGGYVFCGDEVIYDCPMTPEQTARVMDILGRNGFVRSIETLNQTYSDDNLAEILGGVTQGNSELMRWHERFCARNGIPSLTAYKGEPAYKIFFLFDDLRRMEEPRRLLEDEFIVIMQENTSGGFYNGEFINRRFNKGKGVLRVCRHLGVGAEDTIGFGDSMNDIQMMETVGTSVCMADGAKALREMSDMICPPAGEDGIARAFEVLGLMEPISEK